MANHVARCQPYTSLLIFFAGAVVMGCAIQAVVSEPGNLLEATTAPNPPKHVLVEKLEYPAIVQRAGWNSHPNDVANLIKWTATDLKDALDWRVIKLDARPTEFSAAPVLYMAGSSGFDFSDAHIAVLRKFLTNGGIIVANADQESIAFRISFINLGRRLFPKYEFRELSRKHPIFTNEHYVTFQKQPVVWGLTDGKDELMLLIPTGDPGDAWDKNAINLNRDAFGLGADILQYAMRREAGRGSTNSATKP